MTQEQALQLVLEVITAILGEPVGPTTPLREMPGYDSLALAGIIELLEDRLGYAIDPVMIVPEIFATPLALAQALATEPEDP